MSEQPVERVLNAQVIVDIYNTHTDSEVTLRAEGVNNRDIAKQLYAVARHFEHLHREEEKKKRQDRKKKGEPSE